MRTAKIESGSATSGVSARFDYIWYQRKWPLSSWDGPGDERKGQRCRVIARAHGRGPLNILVEFEDGSQIVGTRYCIRRERWVR